MEETKGLFELMLRHWTEAFGTIIIITLTSWGLISIKNANKKLRDVLTADEIDAKIEEARKHSESYTDEKIDNHNKLQTVVLASIVEQGDKTYEMVKFIYELELKRSKE